MTLSRRCGLALRSHVASIRTWLSSPPLWVTFLTILSIPTATSSVQTFVVSGLVDTTPSLPFPLSGGPLQSALHATTRVCPLLACLPATSGRRRGERERFTSRSPPLGPHSHSPLFWAQGPSFYSHSRFCSAPNHYLITVL